MSARLYQGSRQWLRAYSFGALAMISGVSVGAFEHPGKPSISEVRVTFEDPADHGEPCIPEEDDTITILGSGFAPEEDDASTKHANNFDRTRPPVVSLGSFGELDLCNYSATEIVARCPDGTCEHGDYRLQVEPEKRKRKRRITWYRRTSPTAEYHLTIGAMGPKGDSGLAEESEHWELFCQVLRKSQIEGVPDGCPDPYKIVFQTSQWYTGNLGGLDGADGKCNSLAAAAGLPGTYKAWLSDNGESAESRLTHFDGSYVLPDDQRTLVANGWNDLTDGSLLHPIDVLENGKAQADPYGGYPVWTNTLSTGEIACCSCDDWEDTQNINGRTGVSKNFPPRLPVRWTEGDIMHCEEKAKLYCFQQ